MWKALYRVRSNNMSESFKRYVFEACVIVACVAALLVVGGI
jgi:hypothetical protein